MYHIGMLLFKIYLSLKAKLMRQNPQTPKFGAKVRT